VTAGAGALVAAGAGAVAGGVVGGCCAEAVLLEKTAQSAAVSAAPLAPLPLARGITTPTGWYRLTEEATEATLVFRERQSLEHVDSSLE
jgi:hypothetical protein